MKSPALKTKTAPLLAKSFLSAFGQEKQVPPSDEKAAQGVYLDPVIHERIRLAILTTLITQAPEGCSFMALRDTLSLTDGNLMAHLRTLEVAGFIERIKEGAGRASSTTIQLSPAGKKCFKNYLDQLDQLVRAAKGKVS